MTDGEMVLTALGGQAVLLAVLGFLGRAVATHWLDKDLRTFEAKLKAAANESVANMTHELEKAKLEHQVRFSKLHERRADIIAEVYRLLAYFYASSASYASSIGFEGDLPRPEQLKMAGKYAQDFHSYFEINRIWLPAAICDQIDTFIREIDRVVGQLRIYDPYIDNENTPEHVRVAHAEVWGKASEAFRNGIPKAKILLEAELRRILGDIPTGPDNPSSNS